MKSGHDYAKEYLKAERRLRRAWKRGSQAHEVSALNDAAKAKAGALTRWWNGRRALVVFAVDYGIPRRRF